MTATLPPQSAASHARYVPGFHIVTGLLTLLNLAWSIYRVIVRPSMDSGAAVVVALLILSLFWYLRQFPLVVQDRVIRLEERLRLERLLPADMRSRIDEFTRDQLVALRFASDAELPALAERVLAENVTQRSAIKGMIREWRPDHLRA